MSTQYKLRYEAATQTIRTDPENYCVVAMRLFSEGGHMDAAIKNPEALAMVMAAAPEMVSTLKFLKERLQAWVEHHEIRIQQARTPDTAVDVNIRDNYKALINHIDFVLNKTETDK